MPKTTVGLFENPRIVEDVVREIEALGFPRNEVQTLNEPATFAVTGMMSFGRLDFEVDLMRELRRIGATETEIRAYVDGLRRGGALVLATGPDQRVDEAAKLLKQRGAVEIEESSGPEPHVPHQVREDTFRMPDGLVMTGRIRQPADGARVFVW